MEYPEIDETGEIVCIRTGSSYESMLRSVPLGHAVLIVPPPDAPAWWDGAAMNWVIKPDRPSDRHEWDAVSKVWVDRRTDDQRREDALAALRIQRKSALEQSDIEALRFLDALLPEPLRLYRAALRNLPASAADLDNVEWPDPPF